MKTSQDSQNLFQRKDGRQPDHLRIINVSFNTFGYAAGSVLFELGNTKVLCSVSLQNGVPHFLKGKKTGWLTAEYAMLPTSTMNRMVREISSMRRNGRSVEISRLIGRSLRTIVDLDILGERTIYIDCDVLQADGGTRTACITGACLALRAAVDYWLENRVIKETIITDTLAAVSVGVVNGVPLLDLNYQEDSNADADFNFVITKSNKIVEIQGASEGATVSWEQFERARELAVTGVRELIKIGDQLFDQEAGDQSVEQNVAQNINKNASQKTSIQGAVNSGHRKQDARNTFSQNRNNKKPAFFSLKNRLSEFKFDV